MQRITQRPKECWLTSVAMVTGKSVHTLRCRFNALSMFDYNQLVEEGNKSTWIPLAYDLLFKLGFTACSLNFHSNYIPHGVHVNAMTRKPLVRSLLQGKGILCIEGGRNNVHAVAFEDGIIYDPLPTVTNPLPLAQWRKAAGYGRISKYKIDYLTQEKS